MWSQCDLNHRRPRSLLLISKFGNLGSAVLDFLMRGKANLMRVFSGTDPARGRRARSRDGLRRPKMVEHACDAIPELRPSPLQRPEDVIQPHGPADDLGRSCEGRLNPPRMCQLISMPSGAIKKRLR
jgi:hypothetical protein